MSVFTSEHVALKTGQSFHIHTSRKLRADITVSPGPGSTSQGPEMCSRQITSLDPHAQASQDALESTQETSGVRCHLNKKCYYDDR